MAPVLHVRAGRFDFQEVPTRDLRKWWPYVRPGLLDVKQKVPVSWVPEDIFMVILQGRAYLLACTCGKDFAGFMILAPDGDEFSGVKELLIWEAYAGPAYPDLKAALMPFVEDRAKGLGFHGLVMHSNRKGWDRLAPKLGFKERCTVWVKPLR